MIRICSLLLAGAFALAGFAIDGQAQFRTPDQPVEDQFLFLQENLTAQYLTREGGQDLDQIQFLPIGSDNPTHLIACIEESLQCLTGACGDPFVFGDKLNPGVQRIDLATGEVTTIVRGMTICDGIRTTPWGTVVATEEDFDSDVGGFYEILDPMTDDEYTILSRNVSADPAEIVDQDGNDATDRIRKWRSLPVVRWEGLEVSETGVVLAGDEERPGSYGDGDTDGGAIYKWIPEAPRDPGAGDITSLDDSPFASGGSIFALQVSCRDNSQQFGQGCEVGAGAWIPLAPAPAEGGDDEGSDRVGREAANQGGATAWYRPEDLHIDPMFKGSEDAPNAVRFCWAATGNQAGNNYGEVVCAIDQDLSTVVNPDPETGAGETGQVVVNRFVEGDPDLNQPDNLEFQPGTGILYVIEDNPNADIWACLPDGADRDIKTDGCVKVLTLADDSAETTGLIFTPDATTGYFAIQHSNDDNMPLVDDFRTDDVIVLTGFGTPRGSDWGERAQALLERSKGSLFGF